jgi:hypothetical protein
MQDIETEISDRIAGELMAFWMWGINGSVLNAAAAQLVPSLILEMTGGITGDTIDGAAA